MTWVDVLRDAQVGDLLRDPETGGTVHAQTALARALVEIADRLDDLEGRALSEVPAEITERQVRAVLGAASSARDYPTWMRGCLAASDAHRALMDFAIDTTSPGPERTVLVDAGRAQMDAMTEPSEDMVDAVLAIANGRLRATR